MKNLKNISLKAAALCMAVLTTASMVLNPYLLNAFDASIYFDRGITHESNYVNEWDMEEGNTEGGGGRCGFFSEEKMCSKIETNIKSDSGGGGIFVHFNRGGANGSGSQTIGATIITGYKSVCQAGKSRSCTFSDPCNRVAISKDCHPNCSITSTVLSGR